MAYEGAESAGATPPAPGAGVLDGESVGKPAVAAGLRGDPAPRDRAGAQPDPGTWQVGGAAGTSQSGGGPLKLALYGRVSSNRQEKEETIESQLTALKSYARQRGYEVEPAHIYIDEGISGSRLDRPALDRMRDAVRDAAVDAVAIYDPDRLARDFLNQMILTQDLRRAGCEVIFLNRPIGKTAEDQMLLQMQGVIAEYERAKIMERTRRGRLFWARQGRMLNWSTPPYGYRFVRYTDRRGGYPVVEETEAQEVRGMFHAVMQEDLGVRQIVRRLNERGVKPRRSPRWGTSSVRAILTNPAYSGKAYYNKTEAVIPGFRRQPGRYYKNEKTSKRSRDREQWIEMTVPPIVDEKTFLEVRDRMRQHQADSIRRTEPGRYLLRRRVRCGECGCKMICFRYGGSERYTYYRCPGWDVLRTGRQKRCPSRMIRSRHLDEVVWEYLDKAMQDPDVLRRQFHLQQESLGLTERDWDAQMQRLERAEQQQRRRLARLIDAYEDEAIQKEELKVRRLQVEERLRLLHLERVELERRKEQSLRDTKLADRIDDFIRLVREGLTSAEFDLRQRVVRLVVEEVVVKDDEVTVKHILPIPASVAQ